MGSLKRKIARNKVKQSKKRMAQQLGMFDELGDECSACEKPYDKKSKEHVTTWNVVVKEKEKIVRLDCPECWEMAHNLIKEIQNDIRIYNEEGGKTSDASES